VGVPVRGLVGNHLGNAFRRKYTDRNVSHLLVPELAKSVSFLHLSISGLLHLVQDSLLGEILDGVLHALDQNEVLSDGVHVVGICGRALAALLTIRFLSEAACLDVRLKVALRGSSQIKKLALQHAL